MQEKGGGSYCSKIDHYFRSKLVQESIFNFRFTDAWRLFTIAHGRMRDVCPRWRTREDPEQANGKPPSRGAALSVPQVILDVQQFSPDEIAVKTIDNCVVVEAKHEEKQDEHGYISRHFVRRYILPPSHDLVNITSTLSSDGVLTITAPKKVRSIEPR